MCGIAGYVAPESHESLDAVISSMVASLARRGPDGEGIERWPGAVLGHRRLAILDLSQAGRQPMLSDDGEIGVVFNGCIYNFQDIRAELERAGHRFRSNCDTEVLVRGYREWGVDALTPRLRGMFAFAVWDHPQQRLTLVRDRLGVKPLVYVVRGKAIGFASTVTALRSAGLVDELDPDAVLEFLEFGWVGEQRTIYAQAHKVAPATIVEWQNGRLSERQYWTPPEPGTRRINFNDAVDQAEHLLLEASKLRLISDVPVGSLLSGGIDSALVCWAMSKLDADIKAFTVSTPNDPADEAGDARATARKLGIPHEIVELPPDEQPPLEDLTAAYGEPFACPSALAMLRVCKAIKPKATVLLTGDGGDDVFLGYTHHRTFHLAQRIARALPAPAAAAWPAIRGMLQKAGPLRRLASLGDYATAGLGGVARMHDGLPFYDRAGMLGERVAGETLWHRAIPPSMASARSLMREFLDYERRTRFVSEYMTKVDGGAMHYAIEARSPFLDHVLWEFAAGLPHDLRLQGGELKAVLREIVRRRVGPEVAGRRKQGFTVPIGRWLISAWKPQLERMLDGSMLEQQGWIRAGALRPAIVEAIARGRAPLQLWSLVVLEQWLQTHTGRVAVAVSK